MCTNRTHFHSVFSPLLHWIINNFYTNCHLKLIMILKSLRSLIYFSAFIFVLFFTQIKGPPKGESVPIASWQSFGNESETTTRWYEVVGERKEEQVQSLINGLNGEKGGKKAPSSNYYHYYYYESWSLSITISQWDNFEIMSNAMCFWILHDMGLEVKLKSHRKFRENDNEFLT